MPRRLPRADPPPTSLRYRFTAVNRSGSRNAETTPRHHGWFTAVNQPAVRHPRPLWLSFVEPQPVWFTAVNHNHRIVHFAALYRPTTLSGHRDLVATPAGMPGVRVIAGIPDRRYLHRFTAVKRGVSPVSMVEDRVLWARSERNPSFAVPHRVGGLPR